jgi:hypothetical protein
MSGTGPSAGPPDLSTLRRGEEVEGLGEAVAGVVAVVVGAGEAVVVVGAGEAVEVVVGASVVVCCASTVGGASHAVRRAKPPEKTTKATTTTFSKICVRSDISPASA